MGSCPVVDDTAPARCKALPDPQGARSPPSLPTPRTPFSPPWLPSSAREGTRGGAGGGVGRGAAATTGGSAVLLAPRMASCWQPAVVGRGRPKPGASMPGQRGGAPGTAPPGARGRARPTPILPPPPPSPLTLVQRPQNQRSQSSQAIQNSSCWYWWPQRGQGSPSPSCHSPPEPSSSSSAWGGVTVVPGVGVWAHAGRPKKACPQCMDAMRRVDSKHGSSGAMLAVHRSHSVSARARAWEPRPHSRRFNPAAPPRRLGEPSQSARASPALGAAPQRRPAACRRRRARPPAPAPKRPRSRSAGC